jgi:hypothetical protein
MDLGSLAVELAAGALAVAGPLWVWRYSPILPTEVPIHFNFGGVPDRWGPRAWIWLLPVLGGGQYLLLTILADQPNLAPHRLLLGLLKAELLMVYFYIIAGQIDVALGRQRRLGNGIWWLLALTLATTLGFLVPR